MTSDASTPDATAADDSGDTTLSLLLAAAMFVLVVDTSLMNVSISAVVRDLDTTVSGVQSAIALEALVSAAFILISSKVGDLIGRKKAYTLGLLGYATGAVAMMVAQDLWVIVVFWAIVGGLGASLLLPAMQALIHGNFQGAAQQRAYAMVGASAAIAAAVGPLLGGFVTTYLSWRVGFLLEAIVIAVVLLGLGKVKDAVFTGSRAIDLGGAALSVIGMGGVVLGILLWQEGAESVGVVIAVGLVGLVVLARRLVKRKQSGAPVLLDPDLFRLPHFRVGVSQQMMQQITLGGAMIALPIFLQITLEYDAMEAGLSLAPLSLSMFAVALIAGRRVKADRAVTAILAGFALSVVGVGVLIPMVPSTTSGWQLLPALAVVGCGLGLLVSQLNNFTLGPIEEERVSEAAGVNSAGGSFGLSFGLAMAGGVLLAVLAFSLTNLVEGNPDIPTQDQAHIAQVLEEDAEVVSDTQLVAVLAEQSPASREAIVEANRTARDRGLQAALLVPLLASLVGLINAIRMRRLPPVPIHAHDSVGFE